MCAAVRAMMTAQITKMTSEERLDVRRDHVGQAEDQFPVHSFAVSTSRISLSLNMPSVRSA
ncbi:MAG TPA: hypothetical protein VJ901_07615 [Thermoanaerobaculia bacterium]|nr:hypothetical protein [Thermoanaerobaculia bacterium]